MPVQPPAPSLTGIVKPSIWSAPPPSASSSVSTPEPSTMFSIWAKVVVPAPSLTLPASGSAEVRSIVRSDVTPDRSSVSPLVSSLSPPVIWSLPKPSVSAKVSSPPSPNSVSSPSPPDSVSLPVPPESVSLPASPDSVSLPVPPKTSSSPSPASTVSLPSPATMMSSFPVSPGRMASLPSTMSPSASPV